MLTAHSRLPSFVYVAAPPPSDSEFQIEDPLAFDYLAQQAGYWLFRGFTTRTTRAQDYAVVLYGLHLVGVAIERYGYADDDDVRRSLYERWERFWGLATLEFGKGELAGGVDDAMRGVRGARRAWSGGERPLPLDFRMISRQIELGALGAYLSSLRDYGLVYPGTLRPTPAAAEIIAAFWDEPDHNSRTHLYEEYALAALDLGRRTIERQRSHITLGRVGRQSRLSVLAAEQRARQRDRLWHVLFERAADGTTLPISQAIIAADRAKVSEPEAVLAGIVEGRWGDVGGAVREAADAVLRYGRVARTLLSAFVDAYAHVQAAGWSAELAATAAAAFPEQRLAQLRGEVVELGATSAEHRFRRLEFHGPAFVRMLGELAGGSDAVTALRVLLRYQCAAQRTRRWGDGWLREQGPLVTLHVHGWSGADSTPTFPGFKINAVRRLLRDLGRLP
jgi:hypothetical protein